MPEKDPENVKWALEILIGLATALWGVLTYRIWDINRAISDKVGSDKFDKTVETMRKETKEDFRYHQEQVGVMLKDLANDLKREIRSKIKG